jgi:hypothetical protein
MPVPNIVAADSKILDPQLENPSVRVRRDVWGGLRLNGRRGGNILVLMLAELHETRGSRFYSGYLGWLMGLAKYSTPATMTSFSLHFKFGTTIMLDFSGYSRKSKGS